MRRAGAAAADVPSKAAIKVVVDNRGKGAYKPDVYGDSITIERTIHSSGASGYTFKSSSGNIIERKREALVNILDHFVMDIDSPLTILTQDNAKTFLATSNERDLYKASVSAGAVALFNF